MSNSTNHSFSSLFDLLTRTRPVVKWAGGKSQSLEQLLRRFPQRFGRYLEPFVGGGAVYHCLRSGVPAVIADANTELMNVYTVVRDQPEALMAQLDSYRDQYDRAFYYRLRAEVPTHVVERAARFVFLNKTCFNGLYRENSRGKFNVSFGMRPKCPELYERDNMLRFSQKLATAKISTSDFQDVLAGAGAGDFVYCDPPYLPISQTSNFCGYHRDGFTLKDHQRLVRASQGAAKRGAFIAVSNSYSPESVDLYCGWEISVLQAKRAINAKGTHRGPVSELVASIAFPRRKLQTLLQA